MFSKIMWLLMLMAGMLGCTQPDEQVEEPKEALQVAQQSHNEIVASDFKIPLPQGYAWQVTQSWAEHCEQCEADYPYNPNDPNDRSYCDSSHASSNAAIGGCFSDCKYGWDLSLPGDADLGMSALASADGVVKYVGGKNADGSYQAGGWGNTVVIDHGNNICTRYGHLKDGSILVQEEQEVCQGLKIAEIGGTPNYDPHLHFQFEECTTQNPLRMGFTDGNDVPMCKKGNDIYTNGAYTALQLTNVEKESCDGVVDGGWFSGGCSSLPDCPRLPSCTNEGTPPFSDFASLDEETAAAVKYLWGECVVSGTGAGRFRAENNITRAEGLKIVMHLFGHMTGCQPTEPFSDVRTTHWFYNIVRCGLTHGIVSNTSTRFRPNETLIFAEGAKMLVEAAVRSNMIQLQNPAEGHFRRINQRHWAYPYVETLRHYGAIGDDYLTAHPNRNMKRGEYARIAAAMSPCFCKSVNCANGCACEQESFACVPVVTEEAVEDPEVAVSVTNEEAEPEAQEARAEAPANVCAPNCRDKQCGPDGCNGSCGICPNGQFCNNASGRCFHECQLPSCQQMGWSCGVQPLNTLGCEGVSLNCGQCNGGANCVNGQCQAPPPPPPPPPPAANCNPAIGYTIKLFSPGGRWELLTSPPNNDRMSDSFRNGQQLALNFACNELPAVIMVWGGNTDSQVWVESNNLPAFGVYFPYDFNAPLVINPAMPVDVITRHFFTAQAGATFLVRIPAN